MARDRASLPVRALIRFPEMTNSISSIVFTIEKKGKKKRIAIKKSFPPKRKKSQWGDLVSPEAMCCTCKSKQQTENEKVIIIIIIDERERERKTI
jgi:hypothetical protein